MNSLFPDMDTEQSPPERGPADWSEAEQAFEQARKEYPNKSGMRGHDTEFRNFKKKHKDWRTVAFDLYPAIKLIERKREAAKKRKEFVPNWKMFATWINNRCWEEAAE